MFCFSLNLVSEIWSVPLSVQLNERVSLSLPPQLGDRRVGGMQPQLRGRPADAAGPVPAQGDVPAGGGRGALPVPRGSSSPGAGLRPPVLPARVELWSLVTGEPSASAPSAPVSFCASLSRS